MQLKATRLEYRVEDESGYSFDVVAEFDPEWGWGATVTLRTYGQKTAEDAMARLTGTADAFLRQAKEAKP